MQNLKLVLTQPNIYDEFFDNPGYNCIKKFPGQKKTVKTPEANNTIEIVAKPQLDKENYPEKKFPEEIPINLYCRLNRSPVFTTVSRNSLPEFIARCFIFTKNGMTLLDKTKRHKILRDKKEDVGNNGSLLFRKIIKNFPQLSKYRKCFGI